MRVFNLYMKIIQKALPAIVTYFVIFFSISLTMTTTSVNDNKKNNVLEREKVKIVFQDEDQTVITQSIRKEIEKVADIEQTEESTEALKDALFFRRISGIIKIPKGFSEKLLKAENPKVEMNSIPNTYETQYLEMGINQYIQTAQSYAQYANLEEKQLIEKVENDLNHSFDIEIAQKEAKEEIQATGLYFNFLSYALFSSIILGIGIAMSTLNQKSNRRRTIVSPISHKRFQFELTLGHFVFSGVCLLISVAVWLILKPSLVQDGRVWLIILNAVCLVLAILSMAYLVGSLVKNKAVQSAIANVIPLGSCFISGIFVPVELLGEQVLKMASFTPTYWYAQNNTNIVNLVRWDQETLTPVFANMAILLGFAITFWLVTLVVTKYKRTSDG